jgi:hypothetical protein
LVACVLTSLTALSPEAIVAQNVENDGDRVVDEEESEEGASPVKVNEGKREGEESEEEGDAGVDSILTQGEYGFSDTGASRCEADSHPR